MELLIKAAASAVIGAVVGLTVKKNAPEHALFLSVAIAAAVLAASLSVARNVTEYITELGKTAGMARESVTIVLKTTGIAILTKLCTSICKDAGQSAAATAVEMLGTASVVYLALPLMKAMFTMVDSLM